jgi:hypothetical protein
MHATKNDKHFGFSPSFHFRCLCLPLFLIHAEVVTFVAGSLFRPQHTYCLLVGCLFIFESFGPSQADYRNQSVVQEIPSIEGILFTFKLICYFCPGSQKINILTAQYKQISREYCIQMGRKGLPLVP